MTVQEVIISCRAGLTGTAEENLEFLEKQMRKLSGEGNADELLKAINELALEQLPAEQRDLFLETTCINGQRMDLVFRDALHLVDQKKFDEAVIPLRAIAVKAEQYFGKNADAVYYSFRNPFEYHMFLQLHGVDQKFERAPFDFAHYLMTLGFVLIELHRIDEAQDALEAAIRFNPVNADVHFELAELFKLTQQPSKLLTVTRETLRFTASTYALARAYANLGYFCTDIRDFDSAVCFYYESLVYNDHPGVHAELRLLAKEMGKEMQPPTRKDVLAAFEKYQIPNGPSNSLISLAVALANKAISLKKLELGYYFYTIALDLTRDPDIRTRLESLKQEIEKAHENDTQDDAE